MTRGTGVPIATGATRKAHGSATGTNKRGCRLRWQHPPKAEPSVPPALHQRAWQGVGPPL